ncbi:MAG: SDR family oxidoreductase [Brumimicrobium sp.]|nr:SDR family oxidoreductase [Brumimicrobium sp.]
MDRVLIAGANGNTGREIVNVLKDHADYKPVAMIRKSDQKSYFEKQGVETVLADLEGDLSHAVENIDRVIFAAGSGSDTSDQKTIDVDQKGAISLMEECENKNIRKFVMLSAMGTDNPSEMSSISHYLKAKKKADDHLKESGLSFSIVKPGKLTFASGSNTIQAEEKLDEKGSISREDVAQVLVQCLSDDIAQNKSFEVLEGGTTIKTALKNL